MVGGFDFGGEGLLVGGYVPSWCRPRLVGRRKGVGCTFAVATRFSFPPPVVYNLSISLCVQPYIQLVLLVGSVSQASGPR